MNKSINNRAHTVFFGKGRCVGGKVWGDGVWGRRPFSKGPFPKNIIASNLENPFANCFK